MAGYHILPEKISIPEDMQKGIPETITLHAQSLLATLKDVLDEDLYNKLDYSEQSIVLLDNILDQWLDENEFSKEGKYNLIRVFGGYLATILQKNFSGKWWHDGHEVVYVLYNGDQQTGVGLTPYSYVSRRLEEGETLAEQWEDQEPLVEKIRLAK